MELEFFDAEKLDRNVKCSIHKNGKLGFSEGASRKLRLDTSKSVQLGRNNSDQSDKNMYARVYADIVPGAFKVSRAGEYYYLNTKPLFDTLGIEYRSVRVIYDIVEFEYEGKLMYKLIKREVQKNRK